MCVSWRRPRPLSFHFHSTLWPWMMAPQKGHHNPQPLKDIHVFFSFPSRSPSPASSSSSSSLLMASYSTATLTSETDLWIAQLCQSTNLIYLSVYFGGTLDDDYSRPLKSVYICCTKNWMEYVRIFTWFSGKYSQVFV